MVIVNRDWEKKKIDKRIQRKKGNRKEKDRQDEEIKSGENNKSSKLNDKTGPQSHRAGLRMQSVLSQSSMKHDYRQEKVAKEQSPGRKSCEAAVR